MYCMFNIYILDHVENFKTLFFQVSLSDHEAVTAELWLWKWNTQNKTGSKFYNVSKMYLLNLFSQIKKCIFVFEILTPYNFMHYETILEVPKCENGQKVTKIQANSGKIVLFMKKHSFFVCRKK